MYFLLIPLEYGKVYKFECVPVCKNTYIVPICFEDYVYKKM